MRKLFPNYLWFMPSGSNRDAMLHVLDICKSQNRPYIQMALHSSELMPGGSPTFANADAIEKLYQDLEAVFAAASQIFGGCTLKEFAMRMAAGLARNSPAN